MTLADAARLTEILLALALIQHSAEHMCRPERVIHGLRIAFSGALIAGIASGWMVWGLFALGCALLLRFHGPYNGGADKMGMLILVCLGLFHVAPDLFWAELALAYLAVQVVLSYFVSGWVKLRSAPWRSGQALADVFRFSAYPVSQTLRSLADRPTLLRGASWTVIGLEVAFPLTLAHPGSLAAALVLTGLFHLANACVFGLNRFLWVWLSAYPVLIWFQGRIAPAW